MVRARPLYGLGYGFESRHSNFTPLVELVDTLVLGTSPKGLRVRVSQGVQRGYRIAAIAFDCKSNTIRFRRFESFYPHNRYYSSVGRAEV